MRVSSTEFRLRGFYYVVSRFGVWVRGFGYWVSRFCYLFGVFGVRGFGFVVLRFEVFKVRGFAYVVSGTGSQVLGC